jgi:molecular chaperone HtpG
MTYGMISDEKFYDQAAKFALLKNTEGKYFTFEEYEKLIEANQKDKNKTLIYLYTTDVQAQFSFIETAKNKGYDVLVMDGYLDMHFINQAETKFKDSHFVRVDADVIDKPIQKDESRESKLSPAQQNELKPVFQSQLPDSKGNYTIQFESLSETDQPVLITQMEFMRRMKDMSQLGGPMSFYGDLPNQYNVVINSNHPLVSRIEEAKEKKCRKDLDKYSEKLKPIEESKAELDKNLKDKKDEEIPQADKDRRTELEGKINEFKEKQQEILTSFGKENKIVRQLIDIALLSNNMLKGEDLNRFVKRSIELL